MSLQNMGGTFLSNLITRPEFLSYTSERIFEQSAFLSSGVIQRNSALDCRAGGTRVRVPFLDYIAPTEDYDDPAQGLHVRNRRAGQDGLGG